MPAMRLASRPRTFPSAATIPQPRWMSESLGVYVFIRTPVHGIRAFNGTAFYDTGLRILCQGRDHLTTPSPRSPRRPRGSPEEGLQEARPRRVPEPRQRLLLDLPHPLARDPEPRADLLQRHGLLAVQAEVQAQALRLA